MSYSRTKVTRIFLYILLGIVLIVALLAGTLWIKSPGTASPITDRYGKTIPGSISVIEKVMLGGQEQYLIIRGVDRTKPVMLFLHGGPGNPEYAFMKTTNRDIEKDFIMVYWEERGAGKSWSQNIPVESMTLAQLISDTKELSELLTKRFKKDKIYIMGHSWGSLLGILTAYEHPELYYAYFGVGQVCAQFQGEKLSYEWVKEQANIHHDNEAKLHLVRIHFPDSLADMDKWMGYIMVERSYVGKFGGGVTHGMTSLLPLVKMILNAREYTVSEKMNFMKASMFSVRYLWPGVIRSNLFQDIDSMRVPVYIFQGKYDYQTPTVLAKRFYDRLKAPQKEYFSFEHSAHSPLMEEPARFDSIVREKANENKE